MSTSSGTVNNKHPEKSSVTEGAAIVVADSGTPAGEDYDDTDMDKDGGSADPMDEVSVVNPATVFCIRLKQPRSNLQYKMSVPELCRNFSAVAWCGIHLDLITYLVGFQYIL